MDDYSYGQAYADWQAELRQSAASVSAARRGRGGTVRGRLARWRARIATPVAARVATGAPVTAAYPAEGVSAASRPASMP